MCRVQQTIVQDCSAEVCRVQQTTVQQYRAIQGWDCSIDWQDWGLLWGANWPHANDSLIFITGSMSYLQQVAIRVYCRKRCFSENLSLKLLLTTFLLAAGAVTVLVHPCCTVNWRMDTAHNFTKEDSSLIFLTWGIRSNWMTGVHWTLSGSVQCE